ncbi:MAG: NADH:ubiquinone reductase (Na(+)-transporting) subunit D, partial [Victivallales bacterium]|nr:NADH:ubiquinone reductase (Na(+)-transporting) subunit D [Victivallales bacterium]
PSLLDGIGAGLGYTLILVPIAIVREVLGFGTLWGMALPGRDLWFHQWTIMVMPPGAFFMLALVSWYANARLLAREKEAAK